MNRLVIGALAAACVASASAQSLQVSIGVRETGAQGAVFPGVYANGGSANGIEFVNLDGQTLVLDGTWQQFTFTFSTATFSAFAGATANNILDGAWGTIEMIRFRNNLGMTAPIKVFIDDVQHTITPPGSGPQATTEGFEGWSSGAEVMFQEPGFSGSTSNNLMPGSTSGVNNTVSLNGSGSYEMNFQFIDNTPTRWARVTTFNTPNLPNPAIRFDQQATVSFWAMGVPEPGTMIALGLGAVALLRRRRQKN
jgi:hypothetical protein